MFWEASKLFSSFLISPFISLATSSSSEDV
jgi:hypothetical protein